MLHLLHQITAFHTDSELLWHPVFLNPVTGACTEAIVPS